MKYRKDITEYLRWEVPTRNHKDFKLYEHNGLLYCAEYSSDIPNKISHYSDYSLLWFDGGEKIKDAIINKFNVQFAKEGCDIVCRCGKSKSFSAFYGNYEILLRCNSCDNEFSAYSG